MLPSILQCQVKNVAATRFRGRFRVRLPIRLPGYQFPSFWLQLARKTWKAWLAIFLNFNANWGLNEIELLKGKNFKI
jgi:hypothetical protein